MTPRELAVQALKGHDVVFEGIAESVRFLGFHSESKPGALVPATTGGLRREFTFKVLRSYKGANAKELKIVTGLGMGDCGDYFDPDTRYVIFADKSDHRELGTGICSGNFESENENATIRYLRGEPATPEDLQLATHVPDVSGEGTTRPKTKVCGSVLKRSSTPTESTSIYLSKEDKFGLRVVDDAEADDHGTFCFDFVDPGTYLLIAIATENDQFKRFSYYPGVANKADAKAIEIRAGDQITKLIFGFPESKLPSISGQVVSKRGFDPDDEPIVFLIGDLDLPFIMPALVTKVKEDGTFQFSKVRPGRYELLLAVGDDDEDENAYKWLTRKVAVDLTEQDLSGVQLELIPRGAK